MLAWVVSCLWTVYEGRRIASVSRGNEGEGECNGVTVPVLKVQARVPPLQGLRSGARRYLEVPTGVRGGTVPDLTGGKLPQAKGIY